MKKVTTITPCYNSAIFLWDCWNSLKNQTIGLENMECIFIDDASNDNNATWEILLELEKEAPKSVKVIRLEENMRQGGARNVALTYATGEYIQFVDSDDWLEENALSELYQYAQEYDADFIQYDFTHPNGKRDDDYYCRTTTFYKLDTVAERKKLLASHQLTCTHSSKFYRKSFIEEVGVSFAEHRAYEEPLFVYPLFFFARNILVLDKQYYNIRVHENSTMASEASSRLIDHVLVQLSTFDYLKEKKEIYRLYKEEIDFYCFWTTFIETIINVGYGGKLDKEEFSFLQNSIRQRLLPIERNGYLEELGAVGLAAMTLLSRNIHSSEDVFISGKKLAEIYSGKKPKVDILISMAGQGGLEQIVSQSASYLIRQGYDVRVVQIVDLHMDWLDEDVPFFTLREMVGEESFKQMELAYAEFLSEYSCPDIILATGWPQMCVVAKKALVISANCAKVVSWSHGEISHYAQDGVGGMESLFVADAHLCIKDSLMREIRALKPDAEIFRVYNFADAKRICYSNNRTSKTLVFLGRLTKEKNIAMILRALAQTNKEWKIKIIGDGSERASLEDLSRHLCLEERVDFLGWIEEPWQYLTNDAALVVSSPKEGFSVAIIEALLSGMPVLMTPIPGLALDVIVPGENGFLFPFDGSKELAELLNFISDGKLELPAAEKCRESARFYEKEFALHAFEQAISAAYI